ncbi:MAG: hypothetical protein HOV80_30485 [Polyangiaceae bacterium]|nr:hypothetical protein [Polyangiaceae bacterium]
MRLFPSLFVLGVGLAAALSAERADAAERTFTVEYKAAKGCPSRETFVDEIKRRTAVARLAGPGEQPEVSMRVKLDVKRRKATGRLDMTIGTTATQRDLEDPSCAEVVSALALLAALAIDPLAETAHLPPLPLPPDPHVPGEVGTRPAIPEPKLLETDPHYLGVTDAKVPREREGYLLVPASLPAFPYVPPPPPRDRPFDVGPGTAFSLDVATAPVPLAGVSGFIGFRSLEDDLPWSIRAEVTYSVSAGLASIGPDEPSGAEAIEGASFRFLRGRLEGCLPGWLPTSWVRVWPCGSLAGGALWGQVRKSVPVPKPDEANRFNGLGDQTKQQFVGLSEGTSPWFVGGLAGRLELAPAEWFAFELRAGPDFPLVRGSFKDENGGEIFTAPPITLSLGIGASAAF